MDERKDERMMLSVKEVAQELGKSVQSNPRVYWSGEIPAYRIRITQRFDLTKVRRAMKRNGRSRVRRLNGNSATQGVTAGNRRRSARNSPRSVKRGRNFHGSSRRII